MNANKYITFSIDKTIYFPAKKKKRLEFGLEVN